MCGYENSRFEIFLLDLVSESVEGAALPFQSVDDVPAVDGLALGVLGVGDRVADHVLQEDLENAASLLVDQTRDPLDATPSGQSADRRLGNALDVIPQDLAMPLGTSLSQSFTSFATSRHGVVSLFV